MSQSRPTAIILYHFFYPDDVVSAEHFSQFADELVKRGWNVKVLTSNRYCRYPKKKIHKRKEFWNGIRIFRTRRPGWDQANNLLRAANSIWMITGWGARLCRTPGADTIIIGTDPLFAALLFPLLRFLKRGKVLVHWCYDLYPEVVEADGAKGIVKWMTKRTRSLMQWAYRSVDLMVDIGPCMRKKLDSYHHNADRATLVPWALAEPDHIEKPDPATRFQLFNKTKLSLLYSGNMGKAHDYSLFLKLARNLNKRDPEIKFCFACRGNSTEKLKKAVKPDDGNIHFASFTSESELEKRLSAADIHLISLKPEWSGLVVPSKFFGSLAVGRPVLYAGPEDSAIAGWIREFNVGLVLTKNNIEHIATELLELAECPDKLYKWQQNAHTAYSHFSKKHTMDQWNKILRDSITDHKVN